MEIGERYRNGCVFGSHTAHFEDPYTCGTCSGRSKLRNYNAEHEIETDYASALPSGRRTTGKRWNDLCTTKAKPERKCVRADLGLRTRSRSC